MSLSGGGTRAQHLHEYFTGWTTIILPEGDICNVYMSGPKLRHIKQQRNASRRLTSLTGVCRAKP